MTTETIQLPEIGEPDPENETHEARELRLYADHSSEPHYRWSLECFAGLARHVKRGDFDAVKAPRMFAALVDDAARSYCAEFGSGRGDARRVFARADRDVLCVHYAAHFVWCVNRPDYWDDLGERAAEILRSI